MLAIHGCSYNSFDCNLRLSEVRSGIVWGRLGAGVGPFEPQTGPKSTQNDPGRTSDNLKLQPHEFPPSPQMADNCAGCFGVTLLRRVSSPSLPAPLGWGPPGSGLLTFQHLALAKRKPCTLWYSIVPPGRNSGFRAGSRLDSVRESFKIGRAGFDDFPTRIRPKSGPEARFQAQKHYCIT